MQDDPTLTATRQKLKDIIRRDLKLGDIEIADDMPFFSPDNDLDSLDILLLVTSIEREFGFKIPSHEVGRSAFKNVDTLARYIAQRAAASPAPAPAPAPPPANPLDHLPHADPFRFVSRLTSHTPGQAAQGLWQVTGAEPFFAGHFPGQPLIPGVLLAEALAQVAGLALPAANHPRHGRLAHIDIRFEQSVTPPAEVILAAKLTRQMGQLHQFDVSASLGSATIARGTLTLHISEPS